MFSLEKAAAVNWVQHAAADVSSALPGGVLREDHHHC
jgi:hypothetical protein